VASASFQPPNSACTCASVVVAWAALGVLLVSVEPALAVPQPAATTAVTSAAPMTPNRIRLRVPNFISSVIVWLLLHFAMTACSARPGERQRSVSLSASFSGVSAM
jgi:hypothetical protein